jgi:hypothetical protein
MDWMLIAKSEQLPNEIPKDPSSAYKNDGWINWGEWLGNGKISTSKRIYKNFEDAKEFVKSLKLQNVNDWREYCLSGNKPSDIPSSPNKTYSQEGWINYGDWFGTGKIGNTKRIFLPFKEAKEFALTLGLRNEKEWRSWKKKGELPSNVPAKPEVIYIEKGWKGYVDFLRNE